VLWMKGAGSEESSEEAGHPAHFGGLFLDDLPARTAAAYYCRVIDTARARAMHANHIIPLHTSRLVNARGAQ
jgi:hypothetical protein